MGLPLSPLGYRRMALLAAWLCISLAACNTAASDLTTPTPVNLPTPQAILVESAAPLPASTKALTPSTQAATQAEITPSPTFPPSATPSQAVKSCLSDVCIEPGHFFLARPVNGVLGDDIDPTYRYATTRPESKDVHTGVEMPAAYGEPVYAAADGKVVLAGSDHDVQYGIYKDYYGSLVILEHEFTGYPPVYSLYAHLSMIGVSEGQQVNAGEIIGQVGATGGATGPHLHFEVREGSVDLVSTRNPELWLAPHIFSGQAGGAIAGLVSGPQGLPRQVDQIIIQPLDNAGQPAGLAAYTRTYHKKMGHGDTRWGENFALGDLSPGLYQVAFVDLGKVWRQEVEVRAGSVTRVVFRVQYSGG